MKIVIPLEDEEITDISAASGVDGRTREGRKDISIIILAALRHIHVIKLSLFDKFRGDL